MQNLGELVLQQYTYIVTSFTQLDVTGSENITDLIESIRAGCKLEDEMSLVKLFNKGAKRAKKTRASQSAPNLRKRTRAAAGEPAAIVAPGRGVDYVLKRFKT